MPSTENTKAQTKTSPNKMVQSSTDNKVQLGRWRYATKFYCASVNTQRKRTKQNKNDKTMKEKRRKQKEEEKMKKVKKKEKNRKEKGGKKKKKRAM